MVGVKRRTAIQKVEDFRRVWGTSLHFGVQEACVWELVGKHRLVVLEEVVPSELWARRPKLKPAHLLRLIGSPDFQAAATEIIDYDAPWYVWANDIHTQRYLDVDLETAFDRTYNKLRPGLIQITRKR